MEHEDTKNKIKNIIKKAGKKALRLIVKIIAPVIIVLIVMAAALMVILEGDAAGNGNGKAYVPAAADSVLGGSVPKTTSTSAGNSGDSYSDTEGGESANIDVENSIVDNGRGGYKVNFDLKEKTDQLINNENQEVVNDINTYTSEYNREECLKLMLNASLVTTYPDLRNKSEIGTEIPDGEVQGIIRFKRKTNDTPENSDGEYLQYIPFEKYKELKDENDESIFSYFTLDSVGKVIVAGYEKSTVEKTKVDYDNDSQPDQIDNSQEESFYKIIDVTINYIQQMEKYSMPFDLLWTLLVYSDDEEFVMELAQNVLDSEIVITVCDNVTKKDEEDVYSYVKNVKINEEATLYYKKEDKSEISKEYTGKRKDELKYNYKIKKLRHYESNNPSMVVTYADTWALKYKANLKKSAKESIYENKNQEDDDNEYKTGISKSIKNTNDWENISKWKIDFSNEIKNNGSYDTSIKIDVKDAQLIYNNKLTNKERTITTTTRVEKYEIQPGKYEGKLGKEENEKSLASALINNPDAKVAIQDDWIFDAIEAQESICDMEDMLKYIFQNVLDVDLGANEFDFEEYGKDSLNIVDGLSGKEINMEVPQSNESYAGGVSHEKSTTGEEGYTNIVTDPKSGRKYKVYAQSKFSGRIPEAGCSISSEAIVLSGYRADLNYTPDNMAELCGNNFPRSLDEIASDLTRLNVSSKAYSIHPEINQEISDETKQEAINNISNNLKQGKPVIILVTDSRTFGTKYTTCAHYMVLIGFNKEGKPVIADPACGGKVWEEDTLEDIVKYNIYEPTPSGAERGYVLIN